MAKKKKETCPYCGKQFAYLSRHKCKIKEHIEGDTEDKTETERRIERIEETRKTLKRSLKKEEKSILETIQKEKTIYFHDLLELTDQDKANLEDILDVLALQSKIKVIRDLHESSWTKKISIIEDYSDEIEIKQININKKKKDFLWNYFGYQPCFICPYSSKCSDGQDQYNPRSCAYLTDWLMTTIKKEKFTRNPFHPEYDDEKDK